MLMLTASHAVLCWQVVCVNNQDPRDSLGRIVDQLGPLKNIQVGAWHGRGCQRPGPLDQQSPAGHAIQPSAARQTAAWGLPACR